MGFEGLRQRKKASHEDEGLILASSSTDHGGSSSAPSSPDPPLLPRPSFWRSILSFFASPTQRRRMNRKWNERGMPSLHRFVFVLLALFLLLFVCWHLSNFAVVELPHFNEALLPPSPPPPPAPMPTPAPTAVPTHYECPECHPFPGPSPGFFNCLHCAIPEPPPPPPPPRFSPPEELDWDTRLQRKILRRQAVDHYYNTHTWLMRGNVCGVSDGFKCHSAPVDFLLMRWILDVEPIQFHPVWFFSTVFYLLDALVFIPCHLLKFVRDIQRVRNKEEKQAQQEADQARREAEELASKRTLAASLQHEALFSQQQQAPADNSLLFGSSFPPVQPDYLTS